MKEEKKRRAVEEDGIVIPRFLSAEAVGETLGISPGTVTELVAHTDWATYGSPTTRKCLRWSCWPSSLKKRRFTEVRRGSNIVPP